MFWTNPVALCLSLLCRYKFPSQVIWAHFQGCEAVRRSRFSRLALSFHQTSVCLVSLMQTAGRRLAPYFSFSSLALGLKADVLELCVRSYPLKLFFFRAVFSLTFPKTYMMSFLNLFFWSKRHRSGSGDEWERPDRW